MSPGTSTKRNNLVIVFFFGVCLCLLPQGLLDTPSVPDSSAYSFLASIPICSAHKRCEAALDEITLNWFTVVQQQVPTCVTDQAGGGVILVQTKTPAHTLV